MRRVNDLKVKEIDDHNLHVNEHIAYMLSGNFLKDADEETEEKFLNHIREHKKLIKEG